jgi:hypothetical protein
MPALHGWGQAKACGYKNAATKIPVENGFFGPVNNVCTF